LKINDFIDHAARWPSFPSADTCFKSQSDQVCGAADSQLCFDLCAGVDNRFVSEAERVGDLAQAASSREKADDLKVTRGELLQGLDCGPRVEHQRLGELAFDITTTRGDLLDGRRLVRQARCCAWAARLQARTGLSMVGSNSRMRSTIIASALETNTPGYTLLNASLDWQPLESKPALTLSLVGNNLRLSLCATAPAS
jgi:hypothetical protein